MKVYRIERCGIGPFSVGLASSELPGPEREFGSKLIGWKFGCKSTKQLLQWFSPNTITYLRSIGFIVKVLDVDNVLVGDYQVAFKPVDNS